MSTDRFGAPLPGATYNGFSGPDASPRREAAPPREGLSKKTLYGGLAAAIAAGLAFGLWARPEFANDRQAREPMKAAVQTPVAETPIVPVEVLAPEPTPAPKSDGPLDVLPADLAARAEASRPIATPRTAPVVRRAEAPRQVVRLPPPPVVVARSAAASGRQVTAVAPVPRPAPMAPVAREPAFASVPRPARNEGPAFNCRFARSQSERQVCGDEELAALDRRLNRAFNRAVSSGVPFRELRAEQDDWLNIREDASRRSPEAVASIYRQRIRELNDIAGDENDF